MKFAPIPYIVVLSLFLTVMAPAPGAAGAQLLRGQIPPGVGRLQPVDRLDGSSRLNLAIGLPLRNQGMLNQLLHDLYDPASPRFHQYLTARQFAEQFGPTEQDYQAVTRFAQAHGLTVTGTHPNRTLLDVNGAVADVERTLHVRMRVYQHPTEARTFFASDAEPSLDLAVPILGISGLDDFILPRPMNLKTAAFDTDTNATAYPTGSGPSGYFIGGDFRAAYAPGVALNGAGQSVGLFELDGYYASDIADYETLAGLPNVTLTNILLDGFNGTPGMGNIEVALDIEMAVSMAPGLLQVMVYEGSIPNDVLNRMATDNQAKQLSSSWGFGPQTDPMRDQIYEQFAAQGQSMFQASGDSGAYSGAVYPPSDDPNVTVVGGTSLMTSGPGGAWAAETTWSGSGGGISTTFPIPSWQQGVSMSANQGSTAMRNIPDVSCLADILIWLIADDGNQGPIGGSSASTPLWAGFAALANQHAAASGRPGIGFINPAIYAIGQGNGYTLAFHDITTGNNTNAASPTNFFAVPGYDLCTGWGTPAGSNLINALSPEPLQITPSAGVVSSGPVGGPFSVAGQNFILTNTGPGSLSWALGAGSSWLNASPGGGTLTSGASAATVTLSLNSAASNLPAGSHVGAVWFTNLNDGFVQSRELTLDVVVPPVIIQQPAGQSVPLGGTATFTVGTASNALLFFQWEDNGTNLSDGSNVFGSASSTLTISNVNAADVGTYKVVASNAANTVISDGASLSIASSAPVILSQPASQAAPQGATAAFTVRVAGNTPLFYQWQCDKTNLTDGGNVSGSSSNTLTLANLLPANAGTYSVVVSNALGSTPSSNAVLTVVSLTAPGVAMSTLYSFTGGMDGGNPNGLIQDSNGIFYGTTQDGGINDSGTVFQMTPAGTVTTLVLFNDVGDGGYTPTAALLQGPDGALYGTTENGGSDGLGTLFSMTTNGVLTTLVNFTDGNGAAPYRALIQGADGDIYGTTLGGGANSDGTVFRMTANGTLTTLASFNGLNGLNPNELLQAANGSFYGTTFDGGINGNGTVFQVTTNGTFTSLASFNYTNGGSLPYAGMVQTPDGNFLGTTYEGGACGYGTVFQMSPTGAMTTFYSFTGGDDGSHPAAGLVEGSDGNYYGTTCYGGTDDYGTVFRLAPNGALVSLVQFDGYDGANPQAPLTLGTDGNIYGTTEYGGADDAGVIFRLSLNFPSVQISSQPTNQDAYLGAEAVFSVAVVGNPPLFYQWRQDGYNLTDGGAISGSMTRVLTIHNVSQGSSGVYSVVVSNAASSVLSADATLGVINSPPQITVQPASQSLLVGGTAVFSVAAVGDLPLGYQWQENGTNLTDGGQISGSATSTLTLSNLVETNAGTYSVIVTNDIAIAPVTSSGAVLTVFAVSATGTTMAALYSFTGGNDGGVPNGLVLGTNGLLYGTTQNGGMYGDGTIFSLSTNGVLTTLVSFDGTNGATPLDNLTQGPNGSFYGTTKSGGSNSDGTVFSMTPGGALTSIYSFASNLNGINPVNALALGFDGNFYGSAQNSSGSGDGIIFKMTPGGVLTNLYSFVGSSNGTTPAGELTQGTDGNFYGVTGHGGANSVGNVFEMTPGGLLTNLFSFDSADGYAPSGQLAQGTDGNFYGVTRRNTIDNIFFYGTIFKITPGGALTTLYVLNPFITNTDGAYPYAGLIQGSDGNFYGTTSEGAATSDYNTSNGTVFQITPDGTLTTLTALNGSDDGAYPEAALVEGPDGSLYGTTTSGGPGGQGTIFRITFTSAPQITTQPASQTNVAGGNASFNVTVFGAPQLFYQWRENGTNLADGGNVSGSAARVLTLNNITPANAATYSVIVSNALGSVTSSGALLTVEEPPDFLTAAQIGGTIAFTWSATKGQAYQLQCTTNLGSAGWTNLGGAVTATNYIMGASDGVGTSGQKFYRVVQLR
jgi:uncharacterized repeat protein (TIGR03803 family)